MSQLEGFSIKVKNFKCFSDNPEGFDVIKPINLIIGRNNSGKSSLLDIVGYATEKSIKVAEGLWHEQRRPEFFATSVVSEAEVKQVFSENTGGGGVPGRNHFEFGRTLIGSQLTWRMDLNAGKRFLDISPNPEGIEPFNNVSQGRLKYQNLLADSATNPLDGREFCRIFAERNIIPELDNEENLVIHGDGRGATNVIQNFINKAELPSDLVETVILSELNNIFSPDATFSDIVCQQITGGYWEIYLHEEGKGRVPLSQSGSGLKTIILVVAYIHLLPVIKNKTLDNFIFAFEELENNLHPSLLRRLLTYLQNQQKKNEFLIFLTTHSSVAIDLFGRDDSAQIIHVTHDGVRAASRSVQTYVDNKGIIDDLDVRASDVLQSNGIIWVEGPSDRIYLNRWISLWSGGQLVEGAHYQCIFYGGRLLSHLSSENPEIVEDAISILRVNRNAALLMDSDKRRAQTRLNATKKRIIGELEAIGGVALVTKGKEIENYIPADAVAKWLNVLERDIVQCGQYEHFFSYLETIAAGKGRRFEKKKSLLAEQLVPYIDRESTSKILDMKSLMDSLCSAIRRWNRIGET